MKCQRHNIEKDFLFCLESRCDDRFACIECHVSDESHKGHKFIVIKEFMKNDEQELKKIFDETYLKIMNQTKGNKGKKGKKDKEILKKQFDGRFNKYLDEREEEIRGSFEEMINEFRVSAQ